MSFFRARICIRRMEGVLLFCLTALEAASATAQCTPLAQGKTQPNSFRYGPSFPSAGATYIDRPGNFCLTRNFRIEGHYWPLTPEGPKLFSDGEEILVVSADDVSVDFQGHEASSDAQLSGGVMTPGSPNINVHPIPLPKKVPKNLVIKNGSIRLSRHGMAIEVFGIGPQEHLVNIVTDAVALDYPQLKQDPPLLESFLAHRNQERVALRASFMPNAAAYPVRNLHIENMHIRTKDYAVVLQGANSVIRNSVIETDSGTALWLYGPAAVIENNTFIVHCLSNPMSYAGISQCQEMDAPIRLMHGDGSTIRNNHFVLKDNAFKRALSVFDTGKITFEGNTFTGLDDVGIAAQSFRGSLLLEGARPNVIDNSIAARIKAWLR